MISLSERNYLLDSMKGLLTEYEYPFTDDALNTIIDEWAKQKATLIEAFKKHPQYKPGKFMIAFDSDYERVVDRDASHIFWRWIETNALDQCKDSLPEEVKARMYYRWQYLPDDIFDFLCNLYMYAERCISEETANLLNRIAPEIHAHAGQKTSRVVNKLCCYLGYDKADGYNKAFAKYADSLSPMIIKRHTVLSLNPLDYLTMSFGNSWASCHTIDKLNKRDMPNSYEGQYSSGTMSYMLDPSSMVLYTVDGSYNGDDYWNEPKITRQMFHWGEEKLVQGRLYPQDNDGMSAEYTIYRNIVQQIMSTIFEFPNLWTLKKGTEEAGRYINSNGTHYCDYYYYRSCNLSRVKGSINENKFNVGADPICPNCGQRHTYAENISCCGGGGYYYCAVCGEEFEYEADVVFFDGRYYCHDCIHYCDICGRYHFDDSIYIENERIDVCEDCLHDNFVWCEDRSEYVRVEDAVWSDDYERYIHRDDLDIPREPCAKCGGVHMVNQMHIVDEKYLCGSCYWRSRWYF